jgi:flagellar hook assembly protein FlgD
MRFGLLIVILTLGTLLIGGTCQPFTDTLARTPVAGQTLSITLSTPAKDATIAQGTPAKIEWQAANLTGAAGTATFRLESRVDLSQTNLPDSIDVGATGASGTLTWDTSNFVGAYAIIGRIQAGSDTREATAAGRITVDTPPILEFTAPAGDVTYDPNKDGTLAIEWQAHDESATGRLGLDLDTDHTSGNETFIHDFTVTEPNSPSSTGGSTSEGTGTAKRRGTWRDNPGTSEPELVADSFKWDGKDSSGTALAPGTYNLFASVTDNVNVVLYVDGLGQITIPKPVTDPNQNPNTTPQITDPNADTTFLTSTSSLTVRYEVNQSVDALVDVKIDTDDDHANGNERTILSQQFVAANATPDPFDWTGNDAAGAAVGPGIYRIYLSVSEGTAAPTTTDGSGFVFRRTDPNQPLIALLAPSSATATQINPGQTVTINWRDDDPTGGAMIRLVIANSTNPDDHVNDAPILSNRAAVDDGVRDTFAWQVPASSGFTVGIPYYVIAYIENDDGVLKSSSVAAGRLMLKDPNTP